MTKKNTTPELVCPKCGTINPPQPIFAKVYCTGKRTPDSIGHAAALMKET